MTDRSLSGHESNKISKFLNNIIPCVNLTYITHIMNNIQVIYNTFASFKFGIRTP